MSESEKSVVWEDFIHTFPNFALLFLLNPQHEVLLLRRINTPFGNHCYGLPGGQIENGETASHTISRMSEAIIGLKFAPDDLQCVHVMHRKCNEPEFFAAVFKPQIWGGVPVNQLPEQYDDMDWFPLEQLPQEMVNAHRHAIQQIVQNIHYSEHGW